MKIIKIINTSLLVLLFVFLSSGYVLAIEISGTLSSDGSTTTTSQNLVQGYVTGTGSNSTVGGASNPASNNVVLWYAPFADLGTVTLASGDSLSITPTWQSAPYPA